MAWKCDTFASHHQPTNLLNSTSSSFCTDWFSSKPSLKFNLLKWVLVQFLVFKSKVEISIHSLVIYVLCTCLPCLESILPKNLVSEKLGIYYPILYLRLNCLKTRFCIPNLCLMIFKIHK